MDHQDSKDQKDLKLVIELSYDDDNYAPRCLQGPQGSTGNRGQSGPRGPAGSGNAKGGPGANGQNGDDGNPGVSGPQGPQVCGRFRVLFYIIHGMLC